MFIIIIHFQNVHYFICSCFLDLESIVMQVMNITYCERIEKWLRGQDPSLIHTLHPTPPCPVQHHQVYPIGLQYYWS